MGGLVETLRSEKSALSTQAATLQAFRKSADDAAAALAECRARVDSEIAVGVATRTAELEVLRQKLEEDLRKARDDAETERGHAAAAQAEAERAVKELVMSKESLCQVEGARKAAAKALEAANCGAARLQAEIAEAHEAKRGANLRASQADELQRKLNEAVTRAAEAERAWAARMEGAGRRAVDAERRTEAVERHAAALEKQLGEVDRDGKTVRDAKRAAEESDGRAVLADTSAKAAAARAAVAEDQAKAALEQAAAANKLAADVRLQADVQVTQSKRHVEEVTAELEQARVALTVETERATTVEVMCKQAAEDAAGLQRANTALGAELVDLREQRTALQGELSRVFSETAQSEDTLREQLGTTLAEARTQVVNLQNEVASVRAELTKKALEVEAQRLALHDQGREMQKARTLLQGQTSEVERLQLRVALGEEAMPLTAGMTASLPSMSTSSRPSTPSKHVQSSAALGADSGRPSLPGRSSSSSREPCRRQAHAAPPRPARGAASPREHVVVTPPPSGFDASRGGGGGRCRRPPDAAAAVAAAFGVAPRRSGSTSAKQRAPTPSTRAPSEGEAQI